LSEQPIPETCPANGTRSGPLLGFLFGLAPDGVFRASAIALGAVGFYPAFSPLPAAETAGGLSFCGTFRRKVSQLFSRVYPRPAARLRGIAPCGVRTFLPRLAPEAILRPSKITAPYPANGPNSSLDCGTFGTMDLRGFRLALFYHGHQQTKSTQENIYAAN